MARRIGVEVVEHWTPGAEQFGKKRTPVLKDTYRGCWVQYKSSDANVDAGDNVDTVLSGLWIPKDVSLDDADDYFVWQRYPDEKYRAGSDSGRYYNRRGRLRAVYIPVEKVG